MENEGAQFLKDQYKLHTSPEVESAAQRTQERTGEKVPQKPAAQINNFLDRLMAIANHERPADWRSGQEQNPDRGIDAVKHLLHKNYIITSPDKQPEIWESYWENQRQLARAQGHGDIEVTDQMKEQLAEVVITDQESSLDKWVDYLASPDAVYPDWLKYYAIRGILQLGKYDKEKHAFANRTKDTVAPFPNLNREALAYVLDTIGKKAKQETINLEALTPEDQQKFTRLLQGANFGKLYVWALEKVTPADAEGLANIQGEWVKYPQSSDEGPLVHSLQGHGTGWCTAGESTARTQLQGGDFYVYYSLDTTGKPTIPRAAIRMDGDSIGEVRGIAAEQNLDPFIAPIVKGKLTEFPDGQVYEKKAQDMQLLTAIDKKAKAGQPLDKTDLTFLYEINAPIEGFGYQTDPRIAELRSTRNVNEDIRIVFDCTEAQIAHNPQEIDQTTKAYVGKLEPGIFDLVQRYNLEHIYTSFPEGKIRREELTIGGKTKDQLKQEIIAQGDKINSYAEQMMDSPEFTTSAEVEGIDLIRLSVKDLFNDNSNHTTDQIYLKAAALGLELCPAEVGPHYRLTHPDQPMNDWVLVGMKPIAGAGGRPRAFSVGRDDDGRWLHGRWAEPEDQWFPAGLFLFRLRKSSEKLGSSEPLRG